MSVEAAFRSSRVIRFSRAATRRRTTEGVVADVEERFQFYKIQWICMNDESKTFTDYLWFASWRYVAETKETDLRGKWRRKTSYFECSEWDNFTGQSSFRGSGQTYLVWVHRVWQELLTTQTYNFIRIILTKIYKSVEAKVKSAVDEGTLEVSGVELDDPQDESQFVAKYSAGKNSCKSNL